MQGRSQFGAQDGGGADFAHDDAGGKIGQPGSQEGLAPAGQTQGHDGNDGIAGPGNIKDFPGLGRNFLGRLPLLKEDHALGPQSNQNGVRVTGMAEFLTGPQEVLPAVQGVAYRQFGFFAVGGDDGGPSVTGIIMSFGIHHYRQLVFPAPGNDGGQ